MLKEIYVLVFGENLFSVHGIDIDKVKMQELIIINNLIYYDICDYEVVFVNYNIVVIVMKGKLEILELFMGNILNVLIKKVIIMLLVINGRVIVKINLVSFVLIVHEEMVN